MIVPDWLRLRARRSPARPALVAPDGRVLTYGALEARVALLERRLRGAGTVRGDRVLALLPSGTALVELLHAATRAGVVLAPLDPRSTEEEARFAARCVRPRLVLGASAASAAVRAAAQACAARAWTGAADEALLGDVPCADEAAVRGFDLDAPHTVVFTSGTTGRPRGVVLSAGNHLASARASAARLGAAADDRWLACLPLHHVGGLAVLLRAVLAGGTVLLQHGFTADAVLRALRDDGVTQLSLVPTALRRLLALSDAAPGALRVLLLGGARADVDLVRAARARGWPVAPTYGLTESCSQVATARPDEPVPHAGFVGRALDGTNVRVVDPDGAPVSPGEAGDVEVRGPTVAIGALDGDGCVRAIAPRGWLRTADRGVLARDGTLTALGRGDDVIVSGGENVTPEEVEAALLDVADVADAGVAGVADPEWGQVVCAWIVPRPGAVPILEEIRRACASRLARYKLPHRLVLVDALPRTTSGKLKRRVLVQSLDHAPARRSA